MQSPIGIAIIDSIGIDIMASQGHHINDCEPSAV
jgi:hypothetical protein